MMTITDIFNNYDKLSLDQKYVANKLLIEEYPFMQKQNRRGEKLPTTWIDDFPKGWRIAFGKKFLDELKKELIKFNFLNKYTVAQVKEKYGCFRWYDYGQPLNSKVFDIIMKYEKMSEKICIECGKPAKIITLNGWYLPVCKKCKDIECKKYEEKVK